MQLQRLVCLLIFVSLAWVAGTFLRTIVGAFFVATYVGVLAGIGFILGASISVFLSATCIIFILNATSWLFLKMSSEDVLEHLRTISSDESSKEVHTLTKRKP